MSIGLFEIAITLLGLSLLLALLRAAKGPSLPDRVVALEMTSMVTVGIVLATAVEDGQRYLLDIAIVLALVAFVGSVAFAYYLERRSPE